MEVQSTDAAAGDVPSKLSVRFEAQGDGWLLVTVPELQGCLTQARSVEEVHEQIRKAIALALDLPGDRTKGSSSPSQPDPPPPLHHRNRPIDRSFATKRAALLTGWRCYSSTAAQQGSRDT
jgi:predicted RNase H-like HicB family nuclease